MLCVVLGKMSEQILCEPPQGGAAGHSASIWSLSEVLALASQHEEHGEGLQGEVRNHAQKVAPRKRKLITSQEGGR